MPTFFFFSFGLLISLVLCISCSSIHHPIDTISSQEKNGPYYNQYHNPKNDHMSLMIYRPQRSSAYYPRASRNSWFRVSTYQHMKPTSGSEEKSAGDNLMRWG